MCLRYCWMSDKQYRPWSNASVASDLNLRCLLRPICPNTKDCYRKALFFWIKQTFYKVLIFLRMENLGPMAKIPIYWISQNKGLWCIESTVYSCFYFCHVLLVSLLNKKKPLEIQNLIYICKEILGKKNIFSWSQLGIRVVHVFGKVLHIEK